MKKNYFSTRCGAALALAVSMSVNAAPVSITVSGLIDSATGTLASEVGNTITATFLFDLDRGAATYVDLDSSNNPGENFTTSQEFYNGAYGWSVASSSGGSNGSTYVALNSNDDFVYPGFNSDLPFDLIDMWGSAVTTDVCPQSVIDAKGYCDQTDLIPGDGFELGLYLAMPVDWFSGTDLPGYIPGLDSLLFAGVWGTESSGGIAVGDFNATISSMTVSSVPVPAAAWLFGSGLLGLVSVARRKRMA